MANESVEELERKLKEAKALEAELQSMLAKYQELEGRVFIMASQAGRPFHEGNWKQVCLTLYKKVHLNTDETAIVFEGETIHACMCSGITDGVTYRKLRQERFHSDFIMPTDEVSMDAWRMAREYARTTGKALIKFFRSIHEDVDKRLNWSPQYRFNTSVPDDIELDVPYIDLVYGENTVLGRTPFTLLHKKYLITRASAELAYKLITVEREGLMAGSHLYQECDWKYVEGRKKMLDGLHTKVTQAAMPLLKDDEEDEQED